MKKWLISISIVIGFMTACSSQSDNELHLPKQLQTLSHSSLPTSEISEPDPTAPLQESASKELPDSYDSGVSDVMDISGLHSEGVTADVKRPILKYVDAMIKNDPDAILGLKYPQSQTDDVMGLYDIRAKIQAITELKVDEDRTKEAGMDYLKENSLDKVADGLQFIVLKADLKDHTEVSVNFVVIHVSKDWRIYRLD